MKINGFVQMPLCKAAPRLIMAALLLAVLSGCATAKSKEVPNAGVLPQVQHTGSKPLPLPEPGPQPSSLAPTGSLWAPSSGSLFADVKASKVGDMVTITISETSQASKQSQTQTARTQSMSGQFNFGGVTTGPGPSTPKGVFAVNPYSGQFQKAFNGTGQTNQQDSMTAYMTATVVDVLPNCNLVIRGSRWTKVNDEMQQIIVEGIVRPNDINRDNTVLSQNVAEAKIFLVGKGPVTQHNKPGWLGQIIDFVSPF
jgi:flagellar L-ring protein precursor FlgH